MQSIIGPNESGLTYCLDLMEGSQLYTPSPSRLARQLPICICSYGYFVAGPGHFTDRDQSRRLYQVFLTHRGSGRFVVEGREYIAPPDSAVFLKCGPLPSHYETSGSLWEHEWVNFTGDSGEIYNQLINPEGFCVHPLEGDPRPASIMREIRAGAMAQDMPGLVHSTTRILRLLDCIYALSVQRQRSRMDDLRGNVMRSADYIQDHYMERLSVDELAQLAYLSKYYYSRAFKQYMGMTPYEYLTSVRLSHALTLLMASGLSIDEIGYRTGFGGAKNFIRQFRQAHGITPGEYRKSPGA